MPWADRLGYEVSKLGEHLGLDVLRYNRTIFRMYDRLARNDAAPVMRAVQQTFPEAHSLVDVGAGTGAYAAEAARLGHSVIALERSRIGRRIGTRVGVEMRPFNLRTEPLPSTADLAYSFEVAEHLPESLAPRFARFLAGCAPVVLLTAAPPGQGGTGHINEQPAGYWVNTFLQIGCEHDVTREKTFVGHLPLNSLSSHWRRTNILVFTR
jgi:SAM-dependent methyltransferase